MKRTVALIGAFALANVLLAQVMATGSMRRTIWEGQRMGIVSMDSLVTVGTFGMGPLAHMRGEITLVDGRSYVARVVEDSIVVALDSTAKAPFFVHGRVERWEELEVPYAVENSITLETFLEQVAESGSAPFFFRLKGRFAEVALHVWQLPDGASFTGPDEGGKYKRHFSFLDLNAQVIGVFSRDHRTVFTHHDSNVHLHLISDDRRIMGHVDQLVFLPGTVHMVIGRP